jgi:hypothetical protein
LEIQNSLWQQIVKAKYLLTKTVAAVKMRMQDSPGWKALLKIKQYYFAGRKLILNKGDLVRFGLIHGLMMFLFASLIRGCMIFVKDRSQLLRKWLVMG